MNSISTNTDLVHVQNSVAAMEKIETGLAQMRDRFAGRIYEVDTAPGMTLAKADRAEVREVRFEVERARKAGKAPLLALGKWADQTAARITAEILKIETPIDAVVKAEEDRVAAEKQARIDAEVKRVQLIQERLAEIRGAPAACAASHSDVILGHIGDVEAKIIDSSFGEFEQEAAKAKAATLASLRGLHAAALAREVESERIAQQLEELAVLRKAQDERDRIAKAKREEEERIEREARNAEAIRVAGEQRAQREAFEAEQREARQRQADEDRRIADDRAALAREQEALRMANLPLPAARKNVNNPGSEAIAEVVAHFYSVENSTAWRWLREIDWEALTA
jgi:colicin import membrane protein